jgi:hypothetical protein
MLIIYNHLIMSILYQWHSFGKGRAGKVEEIALLYSVSVNLMTNGNSFCTYPPNYDALHWHPLLFN